MEKSTRASRLGTDPVRSVSAGGRMQLELALGPARTEAVAPWGEHDQVPPLWHRPPRTHRTHSRWPDQIADQISPQTTVQPEHRAEVPAGPPARLSQLPDGGGDSATGDSGGVRRPRRWRLRPDVVARHDWPVETTPPAGPSDGPRYQSSPSSNAVVFVRHPKARRYVLRVRHDGTVRVTIPRGGSKREAADFASRQALWIEGQRARLRRETIDGQVAAPAPADPAGLARARRELPIRLLELASEHGLHVARVSIRNQRGRWGSCSRKAHISLNWRLVDMPAFVRDYVLIHELMHLKRMDHSPAFWALVEAACPEHRTARVWLRRYGRL
jgi:predicted metal-dependent hydrolase